MNERLTWKEMNDKYPDRWLILKDAEYERGIDLVKGTVVKVCTDDEIDSVLVELLRKGDIFDKIRTTPGIPAGALLCDI